jgi:hypothetical protein
MREREVPEEGDGGGVGGEWWRRVMGDSTYLYGSNYSREAVVCHD